ncbi:MAG: ammonium transporter [Bdellovibrionaceae bacterium]|nr:ammonium transporter [Pseudobdellovibrionaceae bacterium]
MDTGDTAWVLISTALVMLMTPGLAFFYAGMTRTKNVVSTLFQNFAALGVVGILWLVCGYTLAFGTKGFGFLGSFDYTFLNGVGQEPFADYSSTIPHVLFMLFQCMFAVITPILITGAIAERVKFTGLLVFTGLWSLIVYSPVAHWVWGVGGFIRTLGGIDFAGGMVVHMTAGFSAIMAVILLGKRKDFEKVTMKPYDVGMVLLGTALLWFGWFGFNAGSALGANGLAAHAFATTFFASAACMVTWMIMEYIRRGKPSAMGAGVGAVAGLVAITPAAGFVTFSSALIIGISAGVICNLAISLIKEKFHLDDSLDVIGCHGVGGTLGTIMTAIFASKAVNPAGADGAIYGDFTLLKAHLIGSLAVATFSLVGTFVVFKVANALVGMRVSESDENIGLDASQHDEEINSNFSPEVKKQNKERVA